jgi:hypothetical protein
VLHPVSSLFRDNKPVRDSSCSGYSRTGPYVGSDSRFGRQFCNDAPDLRPAPSQPDPQVIDLLGLCIALHGVSKERRKSRQSIAFTHGRISAICSPRHQGPRTRRIIDGVTKERRPGCGHGLRESDWAVSNERTASAESPASSANLGASSRACLLQSNPAWLVLALW